MFRIDTYRRIAKTTRRCIKNSMLIISVIFKILLNSIVCLFAYFLKLFSCSRYNKGRRGIFAIFQRARVIENQFTYAM